MLVLRPFNSTVCDYRYRCVRTPARSFAPKPGAQDDNLEKLYKFSDNF